MGDAHNRDGPSTMAYVGARPTKPIRGPFKRLFNALLVS